MIVKWEIKLLYRYDKTIILYVIRTGLYCAAPESYVTWNPVFEASAEISCLYVPNRTTILDKGKSLDIAFSYFCVHVKLLLYPLHVKNNIKKQLGSKRNNGISM